MKCEHCRFAPPVGAEGYQDECGYFEKYGTTWKDGQDGCTLHYKQLEKWDNEYSDYLGITGLEMGMKMDFEHHGISMEKTIEHCKHMLGMDNRKTYKRHGREYYRPYRNYWCGEEPALEWFSKMGLAEKEQEEGKLPYYYLTRQGMDWLERRISVVIREEET